jgi:hypothetical protein
MRTLHLFWIQLSGIGCVGIEVSDCEGLAEGDLSEAGDEEIGEQEQEGQTRTQACGDPGCDMALSHLFPDDMEKDEGGGSWYPDQKGKIKASARVRRGNAAKPEAVDYKCLGEAHAEERGDEKCIGKIKADPAPDREETRHRPTPADTFIDGI